MAHIEESYDESRSIYVTEEYMQRAARFIEAHASENDAEAIKWMLGIE